MLYPFNLLIYLLAFYPYIYFSEVIIIKTYANCIKIV